MESFYLLVLKLWVYFLDIFIFKLDKEEVVRNKKEGSGFVSK